MNFLSSHAWFLLITASLFTACTSFNKPNRDIASTATANAVVQQNILMGSDYSTVDREYWSYYQRGRNNGNSIRDYAVHVLTFGGLFSGEWCKISASIPKGSSAPLVRAGQYQIFPHEEIFERNGQFYFKTIRFQIDSYETTCYLKSQNSNMEDVKELLRPNIIIN